MESCYIYYCWLTAQFCFTGIPYFFAGLVLPVVTLLCVLVSLNECCSGYFFYHIGFYALAKRVETNTFLLALTLVLKKESQMSRRIFIARHGQPSIESLAPAVESRVPSGRPGFVRLGCLAVRKISCGAASARIFRHFMQFAVFTHDLHHAAFVSATSSAHAPGGAGSGDRLCWEA